MAAIYGPIGDGSFDDFIARILQGRRVPAQRAIDLSRLVSRRTSSVMATAVEYARTPTLSPSSVRSIFTYLSSSIKSAFGGCTSVGLWQEYVVCRKSGRGGKGMLCSDVVS